MPTNSLPRQIITKLLAKFGQNFIVRNQRLCRRCLQHVRRQNIRYTMNQNYALDIRPYGGTEIWDALSAYHDEYRMVSGLCGRSLLTSDVCVRLKYYPFTKVPMPYASINLINLAIEQSLIVMFDRIVLEDAVDGPWKGIDEYRSLVANGCWLVPKLETKVLSPVPLYEDIFLGTTINKIRPGKRRIVLSFSIICPNYISSCGLAVFEKNGIF